ncbi:MAG: prepilin-type N-terminal cleavage/methylation domain-containing protein [Methylobacter sp.]|nr:prepilin-type N-terminal cleavage/methylation domain-containing protein [Methylobacter sp.]
MKKILHSKISGFSLIEALVASVVVAVAMLGLANLQGITLINSADSRMKTHALNLAQDKIEELRGFANQSIYTGMASGTNVNTESIMAGGSANFTRTWTITDCSVSGNCTAQGNYKQANVTVTWPDRQGDTQTVQLTSYIAEADPVKSGVVLLNSMVCC